MMKEHAMSVGDRITSASEGASHLTQRVVDAVEKKVNDLTGAVEDATAATAKKVRDIAGNNEPQPGEEADGAADDEDRDASEHWADDGGRVSRRVAPPGAVPPEAQARTSGEARARSLKPKHIPSQSPDARG
jgi:hypothetical protein